MTLTFLKNVSVESFNIKPILHETRVPDLCLPRDATGLSAVYDCGIS